MTAARAVGGDVVMNGLHQVTRLGAYLMRNPAIGHYASAAAVILPLAWDVYKAYRDDRGAAEDATSGFHQSWGVTLHTSVMNRASTRAHLPSVLRALPDIMREITNRYRFHAVRGGAFCVDINEMNDPAYVVILAEQQALHLPEHSVTVWPSQTRYDPRESVGLYDQEVTESTRQSKVLVQRYAAAAAR